MRTRIALLLVLPLLLAATGAAAQGMYKCKDAAGKITYAGNECHLLGLKPAGEVADRMNTSPAYKAPKRPAAPPPAAAPAPQPVQGAAAAKDDTADPAKRRCFTIKTAKGVTTRCNEKPEQDDPK